MTRTLSDQAKAYLENGGNPFRVVDIDTVRGGGAIFIKTKHNNGVHYHRSLEGDFYTLPENPITDPDFLCYIREMCKWYADDLNAKAKRTYLMITGL